MVKGLVFIMGSKLLAAVTHARIHSAPPAHRPALFHRNLHSPAVLCPGRSCYCSVYLFSLTESCLVDPASGFAGRAAATTHSTSSSSSTATSAHTISPRERSSTSLKPRHIPLTPYTTSAAGGLARSSSCKRSVAWWGPRVLAVAEADGSVSLVRLPESVNILGASPIRFAPGAGTGGVRGYGECCEVRCVPGFP